MTYERYQEISPKIDEFIRSHGETARGVLINPEKISQQTEISLENVEGLLKETRATLAEVQEAAFAQVIQAKMEEPPDLDFFLKFLEEEEARDRATVMSEDGKKVIENGK